MLCVTIRNEVLGSGLEIEVREGASSNYTSRQIQVFLHEQAGTHYKPLP